MFSVRTLNRAASCRYDHTMAWTILSIVLLSIAVLGYQSAPSIDSAIVMAPGVPGLLILLWKMRATRFLR